jgi:hypothetical protein
MMINQKCWYNKFYSTGPKKKGAKFMKRKFFNRQNLNDGVEHERSMKNALVNFCHKSPAILKFAEDDAFENPSHEAAVNPLDGPAEGCVVTDLAAVRFRVEDELGVLNFLFLCHLGSAYTGKVYCKMPVTVTAIDVCDILATMANFALCTLGDMT